MKPNKQIKKEVKKWSWEFYKLLGYRITDNTEEDKAVHKFMEDVIKKTREQERERIIEKIRNYNYGWENCFNPEDLIKEIEKK